MNLLVLSPDFASHYGPLAVVARAVRRAGHRVVVATGPGLRDAVDADGFEWRRLQLGANANPGIAARSPAIERFLAATRAGPVATIRCQALDRERDLLWDPEGVAASVARLCDELEPDGVLVDHVSFGSTLAMRATGRPFVTLVPGHPSQLPTGHERYGVPATWPTALRPTPAEVGELERLADQVGAAITERWNRTLARVAPERPAVDDAVRTHGHRVLLNSVAELNDPERSLPADHRFIGPLVRAEALPTELESWADATDDRPRVLVALGTFLSHRDDVLQRIATSLRPTGVRAAIATGATAVDALGPLPEYWVVARRLPQVAMLRSTDVIVHHGGNNSVQESLASGARQVVVPFSTDQFANAADLERTGLATVLAPNDFDDQDLAAAVAGAIAAGRPTPIAPPSDDRLVAAVFDAA